MTSRTALPRSTARDENRVAEYLASHPDFFARHPELLSGLTLPHAPGAAVSLWTRQLGLLREDNARLRTQAEDFLASVHANAELITRIHALVLALLGAASAREVIDRLRKGVAVDLGADRVTVLLFTAPAAHSPALDECVGKDSARRVPFASLLGGTVAYCGGLDTLQLAALFGLAGFEGSHVVMPLRGETWDGLLAISSHDRARYQSGLGTEFLDFLRDVLVSVLERHLAAR
jgi:uncharacterized protein YigA (DUF484 family)